VAGEGAAFAVSPGVNRRVVETAIACGLPFAPGVLTPSDIEAALELGCRRLKLFPAEASGGLTYLRNIAAPYNHLGVKYLPLGGVKQSNLAEYLSEPLVTAVGGSWLAPKQAIADHDWAQIESLAATASATVKEVRG
jgi:2-dehydro-3-deoxyphosphogluconate aldolase/(4S)-4-hydroxy-2-oxoglutarate aldolase